MAFFSKFKPKKDETTFSFLFTRNNPQYQIKDFEIGEEIALWNKPNSNTINVYAFGSGAGQGYIGRFNSKELADLLSCEAIRVYATITDIKGAKIILDKQFLRIVDLIEEEKILFEKRLSLMRKKYNPKKRLSVNFALPVNLGWQTKVKLNHLVDESLIELYRSLKTDSILQKSIWLEDENGNIISIKNYTEGNSLYEVVRALNSKIEFYTEYMAGSKREIEDLQEKQSQFSYSWFLIRKK